MRSTRTFWLVLLVVLVFSISTLLPSQALAARTVNGTMTGFVLNSAGKPVQNTTVYVFQKQWNQTDGFGTPCWTEYISKTTTGKSGQYKFSLPAGDYRVWFVPNDLKKYAMEAYPDAAYIAIGDTVRVNSGQTTSRISVALDAPGAISGYVIAADSYTDPDTHIQTGVQGQPMANVPIALCVQDTCIVNCLEFVETDENGIFVIYGLKPFPWQLWVNIAFKASPGTQVTPAGQIKGYKEFMIPAFDKYAWLPKAGDPAVPTPIDLFYPSDPGCGLNTINLESVDFINVMGRVVDQESNTIEGLRIHTKITGYDPAGNELWEDGPDTISDADGNFEITGLTQYRGKVVLYTDGDTNGEDQYYFEFCNDSDSEWGAQQFQIVMGETINLADYGDEIGGGGNWMLQQMIFQP